MDALFSEYEEVRKSALFDPEYYLQRYPDVARRNIDPLVHYLEEGAREGRDPHPEFDGAFYLEQCRSRGEAPSNPLLHYLRIGAARGFKTRRLEGAGIVGAPAAQQARSKAPILVAIESLELAAQANSRARVRIGGWALAAAPITEITASVDGIVVGGATYGIARPDVARLYPDRPDASRSGFRLSFEVPDGHQNSGEAWLTVRTDDGETGNHPLRFDAGIPLAAYAAAPSADDTHMLQLDAPLVIGGAMATPVRADLEIGGWALARSGVAAIEISVDDQPVALADYGLRRLDVQAALPDRVDALASGFQALIPHRILAKGGHTVRVRLRDKDGGATSSEFRIAVEELTDRPGPWALRRKMAQAEIDLYQSILDRQPALPCFVAIMPLSGKDAAKRAAATIASLRAQVYRHWRLLVIAPDGGRALSELHRQLLDDRVEIVPALSLPFPTAGLGPITATGPVFMTVLAPGDELGVDAFLEIALAAASSPDADFLYSDERRRDPRTGSVAAYFKPQWSPALLESTNYIGRLWCVREDLLRTVIEPDEPALAHGEYDLVLRCTERANLIRHVPAVLCERAQDELDRPAREKAALRRMLTRRGIAGDVMAGSLAGTWRVRRKLIRPGLVSIIIPTCASRGLIETCLMTLRQLTAYRDYEIICIENIAAEDNEWRSWLRHNADRVITTRKSFNWARFSNLAAAAAKGDYLLFLNDDMEITNPGWLDALLEHAQRLEIGVVGARLLYPDGRVQHAGMFLAAIGQARHAFRYAAPGDPGYFGLAAMARNVIAVTGACLMTRRDVFTALGGFDESQSIINNDVDFCLRAREQGLLTMYTPHATLTHHEAISRAPLDDDYDAAAFNRKWQPLFLEGDPISARTCQRTATISRRTTSRLNSWSREGRCRGATRSAKS